MLCIYISESTLEILGKGLVDYVRQEANIADFMDPTIWLSIPHDKGPEQERIKEHTRRITIRVGLLSCACAYSSVAFRVLALGCWAWEFRNERGSAEWRVGRQGGW